MRLYLQWSFYFEKVQGLDDKASLSLDDGIVDAMSLLLNGKLLFRVA